MRHVWLVALVLVAFVGTADAKHVSCTCPTTITVPEQGATSLPSNAKQWLIEGIGAQRYATRAPTGSLSGVTISPLAFDATDAAAPDTTPPAAPQNVSFSIGMNVPDYASRDVQTPEITIAAFGRYDDETALVRIDIHDRNGVVTLLTTPRRLYLCNPDVVIEGDKVDVEVRSIDIAGNESEPFTTTVDVMATAGSDNRCGVAGGHTHMHEHHHGHGFEILFLLMLYPAGLIAWLVIVLVRRASLKRHVAEPVSLLAAEHVTRRLLRWQIIWSAMLLAGTLLSVAYIDDDYWIFFAPFLFSAFGQLFLQRRVLTLLERPEADAARRGPWLVVTTLKDSGAVRAADIDFIVARKRGIPTSTVR